jgi:hypothetical protein
MSHHQICHQCVQSVNFSGLSRYCTLQILYPSHMLITHFFAPLLLFVAPAQPPCDSVRNSIVRRRACNQETCRRTSGIANLPGEDVA